MKCYACDASAELQQMTARLQHITPTGACLTNSSLVSSYQVCNDSLFPSFKGPHPPLPPIFFLLQWWFWVRECTCTGTSIVSSQIRSARS